MINIFKKADNTIWFLYLEKLKLVTFLFFKLFALTPSALNFPSSPAKKLKFTAFSAYLKLIFAWASIPVGGGLEPNYLSHLRVHFPSAA